MNDTRTAQRVIFVRDQVRFIAEPWTSDPLPADCVEGRTLATVISPGTEMAMLEKKRERLTPGYASVFEVDAAGDDVRGINVGDRLFAWGNHQSRQRFPADQCLVLPENITPMQAAMTRMCTISMATLSITTFKPPANVLITGLGMVGHLAAQIFQLCGYTVTACDIDADRCERARSVGVRDVREGIPDRQSDLADRVDLIVECSGHEKAAMDAMQLLRHGGEMSLVGVPWAPKCDASAHEVFRIIFHQYARVYSGWEHQLPGESGPFHPHATRANSRAAMQWIADGRLRVDAVFNTIRPDRADEAYEGLRAHTWPALTAALDWTQLD